MHRSVDIVAAIALLTLLGLGPTDIGGAPLDDTVLGSKVPGQKYTHHLPGSRLLQRLDLIRGDQYLGADGEKPRVSADHSHWIAGILEA